MRISYLRYQHAGWQRQSGQLTASAICTKRTITVTVSSRYCNWISEDCIIQFLETCFQYPRATRDKNMAERDSGQQQCFSGCRLLCMLLFTVVYWSCDLRVGCNFCFILDRENPKTFDLLVRFSYPRQPCGASMPQVSDDILWVRVLRRQGWKLIWLINHNARLMRTQTKSCSYAAKNASRKVPSCKKN